jgi:hypothetical protein
MAFLLLYQVAGALVNQIGVIWDGVGGYVLMRLLIQDEEDVNRTIKILAMVAMTLAVTMLYEKLTQINLYGLIAGTHLVPEVRNGSVRAQGPFHHAILAGTFGATLLPLFYWLYKSGRSKLLGVVGMFASTVITVSAASSTPISAYLGGIVAISFWPLRNMLRVVRWGIVVGLFCVNLVMHAPIWWALEHIDFAGGSAGEHRAELIDNFVNHFGDWWLIGTKDNASWGFEMWDVSNQYIFSGWTGGVLGFGMFVAILTICFKRVGLARKAAEGTGTREWYFWLLGAALFSHAVAFFGISYFDQTRFAWHALLSAIIVATAPALAGSAIVSRQKAGITRSRPQLRYPGPPLPGQATNHSAT